MNIKLTPPVKIFLICTACIAINTMIRDNYRRMGDFVIFVSSLSLSIAAAILVMNVEDFAKNDYSLLFTMGGGGFGEEEDYSSLAFGGKRNSKVSSYKKN